MTTPSLCEEPDRFLAAFKSLRGDPSRKHSPQSKRSQEPHAQAVNATQHFHEDNPTSQNPSSTQPGSSAYISSNIPTSATALTSQAFGHQHEMRPEGTKADQQQISPPLTGSAEEPNMKGEQFDGNGDAEHHAGHAGHGTPVHPELDKISAAQQESKEAAPLTPVSMPTTHDQERDNSTASKEANQGQTEHIASQPGAPSSMEAQDSDGSDEVVFRQNEFNMVGPRHNLPKLHSWTGDFATRKSAAAEPARSAQNTESVKENATMGDKGRNDMHGPKSPARDREVQKHNHRTHGTVTAVNKVSPPAPLASTGTRKVGRVDNKKSADDDVKEQLRRLREQETIKFAQRQRGIVAEGNPSSGPLQLARQGPGTDADSPIAKEIARQIAPEEKAKPIAHYSTTQPEDDTETSEFIRDPYDNRGGVVSTTYINKGNDQEGAGVYSADGVIVDWRFRPWQTYGDGKFVHSFRYWLENTMKLGYPVDTNAKAFIDGTWHSDGETGLKEENFEYSDSFLDFTDPESVHAHETAAGYLYNWNLRLEKEKNEKKAKHKTTIKQTRTTVKEEPETNPYAPRAKVYLRPAEPKDIPGLVKLYNWYMKNSVRVPDLEELTVEEVKENIAECEAEKLPFLVAAEQKPGAWHAANSENEMVYGYIAASDFIGPKTTTSGTLELTLFVQPRMYRSGIGRCLVDKMLQVCDPKYPAKRGYYFDCPHGQRSLYLMGETRPISNLMFIVHHPADDKEGYTTLKEWLKKDFGFEEQGLLKAVGEKDKKLLDVGYLIYKTSVDPITKKAPPGYYPSG